jgi:hypothetical protein
MEDFEMKYPLLNDPFLVSGMCDVSIAPKLFCRRSFGSVYVFLANVALILYLAKLQLIVALSTGEGEFIQLVLGGKKVKYVRAVMTQFGFPQKSPSHIFGDNISSISMMANNTPLQIAQGTWIFIGCYPGVGTCRQRHHTHLYLQHTQSY